MEHTNFPQPSLQQVNEKSLQVNSYYSSHYTYYPQTLNPNPNPNPNPQSHEFYTTVAPEPAMGPPGVEPHASLASILDAHAGYAGQTAIASYDLHQTVDTAGYYFDPNLQNWAVAESVQQYGVDPAGYTEPGFIIPPNNIEHLPNANPGSTLLVYQAVQPHGSITWKQQWPKKTKIVQSVYCEVCKIDCNSKDVLDNHKRGKKHLRNLEKLLEATKATKSQAGSSGPVIGPKENPSKGKVMNSLKTRKKAAEPIQDLETKRRKVVQGGAAVGAVRVCTICNVVCNSETVFRFHMGGQKHAAMVKELAAGTGTGTGLAPTPPKLG